MQTIFNSTGVGPCLQITDNYLFGAETLPGDLSEDPYPEKEIKTSVSAKDLEPLRLGETSSHTSTDIPSTGVGLPIQDSI